MNYCGISEAFNNDLNNQYNKIYNNKNILDNSKPNDTLIQSQCQDNINNQPNYFSHSNTDSSIIQQPKFTQSFINAQGDVDNNTSDFDGTAVADIIKRNENRKNDVDSFDFSYDDSDSYNSTNSSNSNDTFETFGSTDQVKPVFKKDTEFDHGYCIYQYTNSLKNKKIVPKSTYNHAIKCFFCQNEIDKVMEIHYKNKYNDIPLKNKGSYSNEKLHNEKLHNEKFINTIEKFIGYDLKETILIICIGIILIIIIDLFVKISKKFKK
jgi:hypothetical protein